MENIITPGLALKAAVPGDDRRGGALTTNNTVSEANKFGVDAVELNPNIEGSMAHDIVELNSSLANNGEKFQFGYDSVNDVYGYIKAGADTVTPFSSVTGFVFGKGHYDWYNQFINYKENICMYGIQASDFVDDETFKCPQDGTLTIQYFSGCYNGTIPYDQGASPHMRLYKNNTADVLLDNLSVINEIPVSKGDLLKILYIINVNYMAYHVSILYK